ncbi:chromosome partitioning protein ParB [Novosphingobium rosa]|uniref:chromosome partitioning protein ParB n=1 Tax=Novosphingobium rosa TaxID=76978 RepID=UPI00082B8D2C|nr:chromosome partitioning protein ParB [Novosphingobium rosa]
MTRWESFTRLVKEGRSLSEVAITFGLPEIGVKRILALGNLLPRIRDLYRRDRIDGPTIRHLTMASKSRQRDWLALFDDPQGHAPCGHHLKAWLLGGQSIPVKHALFDTEGMVGIIADLFGEDRYFADGETFWAAQNGAIETRRQAYLEAGWGDVVIVPTSEHFHHWEHEKAPKRKGGRVYIDLHRDGEVVFHEGYITTTEARRIERGEPASTEEKPARPEITGTMQNYIDLHRHAALRAALVGHAGVALRLMVAHAIAGSPLWSVRVEPQTTRHDGIRESVENSRGEADFDVARRRVLALLGFSAEEPTVTGGALSAKGYGSNLVAVFARLLALGDEEVLSVIPVVMGETLASGSAIVEAVGQHIGMDMAPYWQADDAFFEVLRDRDVLAAIVEEVAGEVIAGANAGEKGKVLKSIIRDHLEGVEGREKRQDWVPRWMVFPPSAYTARGGVGTVDQAARVADALAEYDGTKDEDDLPFLEQAA